MLSDVPRQQLAAIYVLNGRVADDDKLCEAYLRDYCGENRREIAALAAAVRWGVPKSLREGSQVPAATLRANLARRLEENQGLDSDNALWAVDVWAAVIRPANGGWPAAAKRRSPSGAGAARACAWPSHPSPATACRRRRARSRRCRRCRWPFRTGCSFGPSWNMGQTLSLRRPIPGPPSWRRAAAWGSAVPGRRRRRRPARAPPPAGPRRASLSDGASPRCL